MIRIAQVPRSVRPGRGSEATAGSAVSMAVATVVAFLSGPVGGSARAQCLSERIVNPNAPADDGFGWAVDVDRDTAVIGAWTDSTIDSSTGAAYVYRRDAATSEWNLVTRLLGSELFFFDRFGTSVAIDGETIAVGAPQVGERFPEEGVVYMFERSAGGPDAWGEVAAIRAVPSFGGNFFGYDLDLDLDADRLLVGAPGDRGIILQGGAAFIFERDPGSLDAWMQVAELRPQGSSLSLQFGEAVALDGDTAMAGAWRANGERGNVTVYDRNTGGPDAWRSIGVLTDPQGDVGDAFGYAIALDDDVAAISARNDDDAAGSVLIFRRDPGAPAGWTLAQRVTGDRRGIRGVFGDAVDLRGGVLAVGAPFENSGSPTNTGVAYTFRRTAFSGAFVQVARFGIPQPSTFGQFGRSVAVGDGELTVGSPQESLTGFASFYGLNLQLDEPVPGVAGEVNTLAVRCGVPGERMWFVAGVQAGSTVLPVCGGGLVIDMVRPQVLGSAFVDNSGRAGLSLLVPEGLAGRTVLLQAAAPEVCMVSNRLAFRFVEP